MIKINSTSIIYVICPEKRETGGTELAHQLVDCLIRKGLSAFIVYVNEEEYVSASIPIGFNKYSIKVGDKPVDSSNNVLVCPETLLNFSQGFKNIQILFWWMSVDNFFLNSSLFDQLRFFGFDTTLRNVHGKLVRKVKLCGSNSIFALKKMKNIKIHLYQSRYAELFLQINNLFPTMPLSDYTNQDFVNSSLDDISQKEDIILYNPRKGIKITQKIMYKMPLYRFVPLIGLKRNELHDYLRKAKLYIDFGNHPGKDRMPREAAINRCCIITGKDGSAKYFEDVPIPDKYKFDKNEIDSIVKYIKDILENYEHHFQEFEQYRSVILKEKEIFEDQVNAIFVCK